MRILFLTCLLITCSKVGFGQIYQILGPQEILCGDYKNFYVIETNDTLLQTTWTVIPSPPGQILDANTYQAHIYFSEPGTYYVIAISTNYNNQTFSDSLRVIVEQAISTPEVIGCYQLDSLYSDSIPQCYKVCAFSQTLISYDSYFDLIVTGAESYEYLYYSPMTTEVLITWGAGGNGLVKMYEQGGGCGVSLFLKFFHSLRLILKQYLFRTRKRSLFVKNKRSFFPTRPKMELPTPGISVIELS